MGRELGVVHVFKKNIKRQEKQKEDQEESESVAPVSHALQPQH